MDPGQHDHCGMCCVKIKDNVSCILCTECDKWIHAKCANISGNVFKKLFADIKKNGLKWVCENCKGDRSIIMSNDIVDGDGQQNKTDNDLDVNDPILIKIDFMLKKYFTAFKTDMENIKTEIVNVKLELNKVSTNNESVIKQCKTIEKRVDIIEAKISAQGESSSENIIAEINDRKRREKNVIVLNVPESRKLIGVDRLNDDRVSIASVIPVELSSGLLPKIALRRLGYPKEGKTRPLLLTTPSVLDAKSIIQCKRTNNDFIFKNDQTLAQQKHLNTLRSELDNIVKSGDSNKTIKYFNGLPKIVDKNFRKADNPNELTKKTPRVLPECPRSSNEA